RPPFGGPALRATVWYALPVVPIGCAIVTPFALFGVRAVSEFLFSGSLVAPVGCAAAFRSAPFGSQIAPETSVPGAVGRRVSRAAVRRHSAPALGVPARPAGWLRGVQPASRRHRVFASFAWK